MKKQNTIVILVIVLVLMGGSFYGGMKYDASKAAANKIALRDQGGFPGTNGQAGRAGGQRGAGQGANAGAGDFSGGEITAKDDSSITIKTRNGSSQIIFVSPSTSIDKSVSGSIADLNIGQQITANGKNSPDGTLAAQSIQIRPSQPDQQNK